MASPGSVGSTLNDTIAPSWFSERSATKLEFNESGTFITEALGDKSTLATAQAITLDNIIVPNTIMTGVNQDAPAFSVDAIAINGDIGVATEKDLYSFEGSEGDLMNIDLLSGVSAWKPGMGDSFDTFLRVLDDTGTVIPYYSGTAVNEDEFESTPFSTPPMLDSVLLDLLLPFDGTFYIEVDNSPFSATDIGTYELFVYRFNGSVPEPSSTAFFVVVTLGCAALTRRRK